MKKKYTDKYKIQQHWYEETIKVLELIKDLRQKKHISQIDIARKSGIAQPNISTLERTNTRIPRFDTMLALFDAVGIKVKLEYDEPIDEQCCKFGLSDCIFYGNKCCDDCVDANFYDDEDK